MENAVRISNVPRSRRVAFTGYRPQKMPFGFDESDPRCVDFKKRLHDTIESLIWQGYQHFISGGAMGMDMFAAETVLELKKEYPEILLEMVSPFDEQAAKWAPEYQKRHRHGYGPSVYEILHVCPEPLSCRQCGYAAGRLRWPTGRDRNDDTVCQADGHTGMLHQAGDLGRQQKRPGAKIAPGLAV